MGEIRPEYYKSGWSRIECIDYIIDHGFNFCRGNVIKYVTRAGLKGSAVDDLKKARQYLDFEIDRLEMGGSEDGEKAEQKESIACPNDDE